MYQIELADKLEIDSTREVQHNFLEEYYGFGAPEAFLAAASKRTKNLALGFSITLKAPIYNHPEQIATLDLVSWGRVEWANRRVR